MQGNKAFTARILFFIAGAVPTDEEYDGAADLKANVAFRNAQHIPAEGALEACDGVAGLVPERYAKAFPDAAEAIKKKDAERKAAQKNTGDRPAIPASVGTGEGEQKPGAQTGSRPAWGAGGQTGATS